MNATRRLAWAVGWTLLGCISLGACARPAPARPVDMTWTLTPRNAVVGAARLSVTIREPTGGVVRGASVHLEAYMSHPGMAPVLAEATEGTAGTYDVPFAFTMPGDWILLVSAVLPDGGRIEKRIDIANVRPST